MVTCLFVGPKPRPERFLPVTREHRIKGKPWGGLWTCPDNARSRSAWRDWDQSEGCHFTRYQRAWRLTAPDDVRIYRIDSYRDLERVIERWRHDPYEGMAGMAGYFVSLDYLAMSESYDAVHLTNQGQWITRLSHPYDLYGWDVETIFWLRWCFTSVEAAPRRARTGAASR